MGNKPGQLNSLAPPPVNDPQRAVYRPEEAKQRNDAKPDPNADPQTDDRIFRVASRQRWGDADVSEMHRDGMTLDGTALNTTPPGAESEEGALSIEELREALDDAGVEYGEDDDRDTLQALYDENELGEEEFNPNTLTVAELKEALDGAKVEYKSDAKKAELVQLYIDNITNAEEEEEQA